MRWQALPAETHIVWTCPLTIVEGPLKRSDFTAPVASRLVQQVDTAGEMLPPVYVRIAESFAMVDCTLQTGVPSFAASVLAVWPAFALRILKLPPKDWQPAPAYKDLPLLEGKSWLLPYRSSLAARPLRTQGHPGLTARLSPSLDRRPKAHAARISMTRAKRGRNCKASAGCGS